MYNDSINFVVQSIEKSPIIETNGCYYQTLQNILPESVLNRLVKLNLSNCSLEKLERQYRKERVTVDKKERIVKELNLIFRSSKIINSLQQKYKTKLFNVRLKPDSVDVWFDQKGYDLRSHLDDSRIAIALQIYLDTDPKIPGTALYNDELSKEPYCTFKYIQNTGYSLLNNTRSWHGTEYRLTNNKLRKSVYIRYAWRS